jgi:hypothetical protein
MIMGNTVRYRLGVGGLIGVGLLTLATLPGCSTGQASDEPATAEVELPGTALPRLLVNESDNSGLPDLPDPRNPPLQSVQEGASKADPFSPIPENRDPAKPQEIPALPAPIAPALDAVAESPPTKPGASSIDERMQRLEERFDLLLKELRGSKSPPVGILPVPIQNKDPKPMKETVVEKTYRKPEPKPASQTPMSGMPGMSGMSGRMSKLAMDSMKKSQRADSEAEQVSLTRATYKLPPGRAQAIAAFFTQNLNDEIEVRVKGDGLQVTASADDQAAIGQFIRLVQTRGAVEPKPSPPHGDPLDVDTKAEKPRSF